MHEPSQARHLLEPGSGYFPALQLVTMMSKVFDESVSVSGEAASVAVNVTAYDPILFLSLVLIEKVLVDGSKEPKALKSGVTVAAYVKSYSQAGLCVYSATYRVSSPTPVVY